MSEPFSAKKLFDLSPLGFYKVIGLSIKMGLILLVIFAVLWIKNLLLPQKPAVENITVSEGGKVYINEQKRRLEFFAGPTASVDNDGEWRVGAFGGVKW